jgi:hypothetical protein
MSARCYTIPKDTSRLPMEKAAASKLKLSPQGYLAEADAMISVSAKQLARKDEAEIGYNVSGETQWPQSEHAQIVRRCQEFQHLKSDPGNVRGCPPATDLYHWWQGPTAYGMARAFPICEGPRRLIHCSFRC